MSRALKHVCDDGRCSSPWEPCVRTSSCNPDVSLGSLSRPQTNPRNCLRSWLENASRVVQSQPMIGSVAPPSSLFLMIPRSTSRSTETSPLTRTISSVAVKSGSISVGTLLARPRRIASTARSHSCKRSSTAAATNLWRSFHSSARAPPPFPTGTTRPDAERTLQTIPGTSSTDSGDGGGEKFPAAARPPAAAAGSCAGGGEAAGSGKEECEMEKVGAEEGAAQPITDGREEKRIASHSFSDATALRDSMASTKRSSTPERSRIPTASPRKRRQTRGGRSSPTGFDVRIPDPMSFPMKVYCLKWRGAQHAGFGRNVSLLNPTMCREFGTGMKRGVASLWRSPASSRTLSRKRPP
mmetsp:Transcript_17718/g.42775  ORF Transcript_17718/g.42775 Transcript_17718/m.42775 type:complete len:354 (+) Transcript_17718:310-1371(+)